MMSTQIEIPQGLDTLSPPLQLRMAAAIALRKQAADHRVQMSRTQPPFDSGIRGFELLLRMSADWDRQAERLERQVIAALDTRPWWKKMLGIGTK